MRGALRYHRSELLDFEKILKIFSKSRSLESSNFRLEASLLPGESDRSVSFPPANDEQRQPGRHQ